MVHELKLPPYAALGLGLEKLRGILDRTGCKNLLLVTDRGVRGAGLLEPVMPHIPENILTHITDRILPEPSYLQVQEVVDEADRLTPDAILAVGGGSVIDTAKLISLLIGGSLKVRDLLDDPLAAKKQLPVIAIPTTCGTGAEATVNAIVAVPEKDIKVGIVNPSMIPDYVILDPSMIARLPKPVLASTAVDALSHCVECFTSNKANPFSDTFAREGARLIFNNLKNAYLNAEDEAGKRALLLAAYYGGVAITSSGTTAVHALSYPLGGKFHIPHGVSNAILIGPVMRGNKDACRERLAELCDAVWPQHYSKSQGEKADYVIEQIESLVEAVEIPRTLASFGVSLKDLDFLTEAAFGVKRLLNNNRKDLTPEDIREIYRKVITS